MFTTQKISSDLTRAIVVQSKHPHQTTRSKALYEASRSESVFGSKSYRDALQRAFNKAKEQVFFNPDMTHFITLTYKGTSHSIDDVMHDIKMLVKRENRACRDRAGTGSTARGQLKYIWIAEYQKRGSIHVHMIANDCFTLQVNKNGYKELTFWQKGFSSVLTINDFDNNFRPYLYLFKYMKKSQRIGKSFVHTSRNLNNYTTLNNGILTLSDWDTVNMEYTFTKVDNTEFDYFRSYLVFHDNIDLQQLNDSKRSLEKCIVRVTSPSTRELEKLLANLSPL